MKVLNNYSILDNRWFKVRDCKEWTEWADAWFFPDPKSKKRFLVQRTIQSTINGTLNPDDEIFYITRYIENPFDPNSILTKAYLYKVIKWPDTSLMAPVELAEAEITALSTMMVPNGAGVAMTTQNLKEQFGLSVKMPKFRPQLPKTLTQLFLNSQKI